MPDLASHALISFAGIRAYDIINRKKTFTRSIVYLFVLGNILPDLLDKTIPYAIVHLYPDTGYDISLFYLHTPVMLLSAIYIFSLFFTASYRKRAFTAVSTGAFIHLILDLFQGNICDTGYMWFFPFSTAKPMVINLFYDDTTTSMIPIFVIIAIVIELFHKKVKIAK